MLYMTELEHGPDTCIAAKNDLDTPTVYLLAELKEIALECGAEIVGGWAFPIGHRLWYIVEAPDAHTVANVFHAAQAHHWNTVNINPVIGHETFRRTFLGRGLGRGESAVSA